MFHIGICDDDPVSLARLSQITDEILTEHGTPHRLISFRNIAALEEYLSSSSNTLDFLLLDILMEGKNGMDFATQQAQGELTEIPLLFVTSTMDYVLDAYHVNSLDYLLKPVQKDDLEAALLRIRKKFRK